MPGVNRQTIHHWHKGDSHLESCFKACVSLQYARVVSGVASRDLVSAVWLQRMLWLMKINQSHQTQANERLTLKEHNLLLMTWQIYTCPSCLRMTRFFLLGWKRGLGLNRLGWGVLLKDTSTLSEEELGVELATFWLQIKPHYIYQVSGKLSMHKNNLTNSFCFVNFRSDSPAVFSALRT